MKHLQRNSVSPYWTLAILRPLVFRETYQSPDCKESYGVFDFGPNTFKVLKDCRTFEDACFDDYRYGKVVLPVVGSFQGARAIDVSPLSSDVSPLTFPV